MILIMSSCSSLKDMGSSFSRKPIYMSSKWKKKSFDNSPSILTTSIEKIPTAVFSIVKTNSNFSKLKKDSVEVTTYSGQKYIGVLVKKDPDGYFIKLNNLREIYLAKFEIKNIIYLSKSDERLTPTNEQAIDPLANEKDNSNKRDTTSKFNGNSDYGESSHSFSFANSYESNNQQTAPLKKTKVDSSRSQKVNKVLKKMGIIALKVLLGFALTVLVLLLLLIILLL